MKHNSMHKRLPLIICIVIAGLAVVGIMRRSEGRRSGIAEEFTPPGGDTLAVAIEMSPLTYNLRNDTIEGFDYLLLRDIAREHGIPVVFHPFSQLEDAFLGLYEHRYNLLVASVPSTSTLKKYFPLTDAVYLDKQVLVQLADSAGGRGPILSQEQLRGDTVWIAEGSPFRTRLNNMAKELGDTITIFSDPEHSSEHLAIMTATGDVKHAVVNEAVARRIAAIVPAPRHSNPHIVQPIPSLGRCSGRHSPTRLPQQLARLVQTHRGIPPPRQPLPVAHIPKKRTSKTKRNICSVNKY